MSKTAEEYALDLANLLTVYQKNAGVPMPGSHARVEIMRTILSWMGCPQPEPKGKMSYADLIRYAEAHGADERAVLRYFAHVQVEFMKELPDDQLIEAVLEGGFTMSVEDLSADWEEHTVDEQDAIIPLMVDWWSGEVKNG